MTYLAIYLIGVFLIFMCFSLIARSVCKKEQRQPTSDERDAVLWSSILWPVGLPIMFGAILWLTITGDGEKD